LSSAKAPALAQDSYSWDSISPRNLIRWPRSIAQVLSRLRERHDQEEPFLRTLSHHKRGVASMYDSIEKVKLNGAKRGSSIRSFCKSIVRRIHLRHPGVAREQDKAAAASAPLETCRPVHESVNRVTKQGRFDWGSFCAFQDGSIEVERAGVRRRFRNFSELQRSLNHRRFGRPGGLFCRGRQH